MEPQGMNIGLGEMLVMLVCGGGVSFVVLLIGLAILVKVLKTITGIVGKLVLVGCYLLIVLGCCLLLLSCVAAPMFLGGA